MEDYKIEKLTDCKWLNLYNIAYRLPDGSKHNWQMASRKNNPVKDVKSPDAVYIIPIISTKSGNKLVVTKEFRVPLWDIEYGFPAGLVDQGEDITGTAKRELKEETGLDLISIDHISKPVYSSAGMTDESCVMVFCRASGTVSSEHLEGTEQIETVLMDIDDVNELLASDKKMSSKAWGVFYHYSKLGNIT